MNEFEKEAIRMVSRFMTSAEVDLQTSRNHALVCVDEIIKACEFNHTESHNTDYWNKVKEVIQKVTWLIGD